MAGTVTINIAGALVDLGDGVSMSQTVSITDVDEHIHQIRTLAATSSESLSLGSIATDSVQGVVIKLVSGGSTAATGLAIDMEASTYATAHAILLQGEMIWWRPGASTVILSVRNLNSSACVYEYLLFGIEEA